MMLTEGIEADEGKNTPLGGLAAALGTATTGALVSGGAVPASPREPVETQLAMCARK